MTLHKLKTWPEFFDAVMSLEKNFEVRKDDRNFQVGDMVLLEEWCPAREDYTGRSWRLNISYVLRGGQFGIEAGYVVLALN